MLKDPSIKMGTDLAIVDVRDEDFKTGNIVGATNIPAHEFLESVEKHKKTLENVKILTFHCAMSQVRG